MESRVLLPFGREKPQLAQSFMNYLLFRIPHRNTCYRLLGVRIS